MNIVWPATALYLGVSAVWAYFRFGRSMSKEAQQRMSEEEDKKKMMNARANPSWTQVGIAAAIVVQDA